MYAYAMGVVRTIKRGARVVTREWYARVRAGCVRRGAGWKPSIAAHGARILGARYDTHARGRARDAHLSLIHHLYNRGAVLIPLRESRGRGDARVQREYDFRGTPAP